MRVIDAHVHFWDPATLRYPWLESLPALRRSYLPRDYPPFAEGEVDAVIFVEANCVPAQAVAEVDFVDELAEQEPRIAGIVAFTDMLDEAGLEKTLDRVVERERVVGVRHNIQGHHAGFGTSPRFVSSVERVGDYGLTFDLCVTASQLDDAAYLVESCPETQFVLDHCGKPAIRDDAFDEWARDLAALASCSNVACKLSGLLTEARPDQRNARTLRPYLEHVLACFGPARLLYGSDWPVVEPAGGEATWREIVASFASTWTATDQQRLFGDNAVRLYGLELHANR
jgi:L-fuconolactonase